MIGYLFFIIAFLYFYIKFVPTKLYYIFFSQLFILCILLIISNILSSNFSGVNYPAIFNDGFKYHVLGHIWADNVGIIPRLTDIGMIAEKWPLYIHQLGRDAIANPFSFLAPGYTILVVGNIYNLFGVNPILVKLFNILLFQLSGLVFYKLIYKPNNYWKTFLKLFMFFPILMFYSVTLLKEILILLLVLLCIYSMKVLKSHIIFFAALSILFITRPPAIFIMGFAYIISLIKMNNLRPIIYGTTISVPILIILWNIEIGGFGLKYVMNDMYFGITPRGSPELRFNNGFDFFEFILLNPLFLFRPLFFGFIDVVMNPNPWNFMYLIDPYNSKVGFSYYWEQTGHYISSFSWYYFLFLIFPPLIILVKQKKLIRLFKSNILIVSIYFMNLVYMGFRADLRYKFVFMPILMMIGFEIFNSVKVPQKVSLKYVIFFIIAFISLAIFDTFFWGRSKISII